MTDSYSVVGKKLFFGEGQSYILYISDEEAKPAKKLYPLTLGEKFEVCGKTDNYLTLDFLRYSLDGKNFSEPLHHMGVFNELLKKRYAGKVYLQYRFAVEELPENCSLLAENTNTVWVKVNDRLVTAVRACQEEDMVNVYDVAGKPHKGENEVTILIDYHQNKHVYYVLFGDGAAESSYAHCLAYDTTIEAIYLKGDFGVYGDFEQGNAEDILLGQNFRIGKPKKEIGCLITDGFPFLSGDITLKQKFYVEDTAAELVLDKRFQLVDVKINGEYVGRMMLSNRLDLSEYLQKGENEIELVLTLGNRNLLGTFHTPEQEQLGCGPETFERMGQWKDGKCENLKEYYAFVKTIL